MELIRKYRWKLLTGKIYGLKQRLVEVSLLAICLQLITITLPLFTQWVIDSAISAGDKDFLKIILFTFAFTLIFQVILEITSAWTSITIETQFGTQWSLKVTRHLLRLPLKWFDLHQTGDVISRIQSQQAIQIAITTKLTQTFIDAVFLTASLIIISLYSLTLTAVALVATIIYIVIRLVSFTSIREYSQLQIGNDAALQTILIENLQCMQTIKISGIESRRTEKWTTALLASTFNGISIKKFSLAISALHNTIQGAESILILGIGATLVIDKELSLGMLMAFVAYKTEFAIRAQRVVDNVVEFAMLKVHVDRLSGILHIAPENITPEAASAGTDESPEFQNIELIDVSFRYGDNDPWIINKLSLTIQSGEHIAITGPTGCGKSTLAKIILGLVSPTSGQIRINGKSIEDIGLKNWRKYFAAVMQNDHLFSATIAENIAHSENCDISALNKALDIAQMGREISSMTEGFHTLLQPMGSNLSGGQRQRISIARAIYKNSPILLFDEATSHLDMATEKALNDAIKRLPITVISIAHRAETIKAATREFKMPTF